jgi:COMPASS component SWD1
MGFGSTCDPPQRHAAVRFDAHVVSASFHPKNRQEFWTPVLMLNSYISAFDSQILLVLLATGEAFVCDMRKEYKSRVELLEILMDEGHVDEDDENNGNVRVRYDSCCSLKTLSYLVYVRFPVTVARFDPSGKFIFIGTASGKVLVFNTRTKMVRLSLFIFLFDPNQDLDDRSS